MELKLYHSVLHLHTDTIHDNVRRPSSFRYNSYLNTDGGGASDASDNHLTALRLYSVLCTVNSTHITCEEEEAPVKSAATQ